MEQAAVKVLEWIVSGAFGVALEKVLKQYIGVPLIIEAVSKKHAKKFHEYTGKKLVHDYWRDLLGEQYGFFPTTPKTLWGGNMVTFKDVIITEFVPRAPGFYYSKALWENPKMAPISLGTIRVMPNEQANGRRLLALHKASEFEAHAEIEKGIPIVFTRKACEKLGRSLQETGAVYVPSVSAIMSDLADYSLWLKMADMPSTFPVVPDERHVKKGGDPAPIMGNAWVVYRTPRKAGFANFRFWAGVNYHADNLDRAKRALDKLVPRNGWVLTDFDENVSHWDAPLRLDKVRQYLEMLTRIGLRADIYVT